MKTLLVPTFALFLGGTAAAADYYIYKDSAGRTVLSNLAPRASSARQIVKQELKDATAAEIAVTEKANQETERINLVRDVVNSYVRHELALTELVNSSTRAVEANGTVTAGWPFVNEWNQVAVSVGQTRRSPVLGRGHRDVPRK